MKDQTLCGKLAGRYMFQVYGPDGEPRVNTGWFDNLITDIGLNRIGTGGVGIRCAVGSGSTPPTTSDTALQTLIASTENLRSSNSGAQASAPYFGWTRKVWRFTAGQATGNISEVGVGWIDTTLKVFSRALVLDEMGDPTTITVLPDETLDVTFELRQYVPTDDVPFTITISGVEYTGIIRAAVANTPAWSPEYLLNSGSLQQFNFEPRSGPIGTIIQSAGGTGGAGTANASLAAYANNSNKRTGSITFALDIGNISGGIGAMNIYTTYPSLGSFQASFSPKIPKTSSQQLSLPVQWTWARYAP